MGVSPATDVQFAFAFGVSYLAWNPQPIEIGGGRGKEELLNPIRIVF